jgi:hypothetical protein
VKDIELSDVIGIQYEPSFFLLLRDKPRVTLTEEEYNFWCKKLGYTQPVVNVDLPNPDIL